MMEGGVGGKGVKIHIGCGYADQLIVSRHRVANYLCKILYLTHILYLLLIFQKNYDIIYM